MEEPELLIRMLEVIGRNALATAAELRALMSESDATRNIEGPASDKPGDIDG